MVVRQGEIYWTDFGILPGSTAAYRRPVVVVQDDAFNESGIATALVCPLTTNLLRAGLPGHVMISRCGRTGLPSDSVTVPTLVQPVDIEALDNRIGSLADRELWRVLSGIALVLTPI